VMKKYFKPKISLITLEADQAIQVCKAGGVWMNNTTVATTSCVFGVGGGGAPTCLTGFRGTMSRGSDISSVPDSPGS
ncbi:MAG: hypothetical protein PHP69_07000, partial [Candidatus Omnitrophica bacterium]|nr:hypothetical protein [Candidatus Omnitrophota bacterium]